MSARNAAVMAVIGLFLAATMSFAMPLNLSITPPDIFCQNEAITYSAAGAGPYNFSASGVPVQYNVPPMSTITGGSCSLLAFISNGGVASTGLLTVSGTTAGGSGGSGVLLTGDLSDFGFQPDGSSGVPTFEFKFDITGGALADDFGGIDATIAMILTGGFSPAFAGNFMQDYNSAGGVADVASLSGGGGEEVIPEPMTCTLFLAGAAGMFIRRRSRARSS